MSEKLENTVNDQEVEIDVTLEDVRADPSEERVIDAPFQTVEEAAESASASRDAQDDREHLNDIQADDWVSRYVPSELQPYLRLARVDRPVGTWLALLPVLAALVLAAAPVPGMDGWPGLGRLIVFCLGAFLMRSAGCAINDIWDRDFDKHVARTCTRPITSGQLTVKQAVVFFVLLLLLSALLLFFINPLSRWLALIIVPLTIIYPLAKRFTYGAQIVLSLAFNIGVLIAFTDVQNVLPLGAVTFWLGVVFWQIGYDTMYGYADREDDAKLGLKSMAMLWGDEGGKKWLGRMYLVAVAFWVASGAFLEAGGWYFFGILMVAVQMIGQIRLFDPQDRSGNFKLFRMNMLTGILLIIAAVMATWHGSTIVF